jgi:hypothetical protein
VSYIDQHVRNRRCDDATIAAAYWHSSETESAARSSLLTQESLAVLLHTQPNQREPTKFERLSAQEALRVKERAKLLPEGQERERLSREARQLEVGSHINAWISSPGLRPPR